MYSVDLNFGVMEKYNQCVGAVRFPFKRPVHKLILPRKYKIMKIGNTIMTKKKKNIGKGRKKTPRASQGYWLTVQIGRAHA